MRKFFLATGIAAALFLAWFGIWNAMMADGVAQVKATLGHHYKQLRERNQMTSLESDKIYATGFPFSFKVAMDRATLSMVEGKETFAISLPVVTLSRNDATSFRVELPLVFQALYALNGQPPEHYVVRADALPQVTLKADAAEAALTKYGAQYPKSIILEMQLGADKRSAEFMMPVWLNVVREYEAIPADLSRPLQLFVGVLREALVYKTGENH